LSVLGADFNQKIGEKSIRRTQDVKAQDGRPTECPKGFFRNGGVVLMDIGPGMNENDIRALIVVQADQVFQDFLPDVGETTCLKGADDHVLRRDPQDRHTGAVFLDNILQVWIPLVIGQGYTDYLRHGGNMGDQGAATQLYVIRVSS
jgi:hypothetical protein